MKPKVVAFRSDQCGVSWYRMRNPLRAMVEQDAIELRSTTDLMPIQFYPKDQSPEQIKIMEAAQAFYMGIADGADVLHTQRFPNQMHYGLFNGISLLNGLPWVIDIDDDVINVDVSNPAYETYRYRTDDECYLQRPIMKPEEAKDNEIVVERLEDKQLLAVSLKHEDARELTVSQIKRADAMFVTTQDLANLYRSIRQRGDIYVIPNSLNVEMWDAIERPADHAPEVWVGWCGSTSHARDINILIDVADYVLREYRNTRFFWNRMPHPRLVALSREFGKRCVMYDGWVQVEDWREYYVSMNFDIALGPLVDTAFNRGKSNLKWLEAGVCRQPFVCSNVGPYQPSIRHGRDGFKCTKISQWKRALDELIRSKTRREDIGGAARRRVETDFNVKTNARLWVEAYKDIAAKLGPMARERTARIKADAVSPTD